MVIGVCQWSLVADGPEALAVAAGSGFEAMHLDGGVLPSHDWLPDGPAVVSAYSEAANRAGVRIVAVAPARLNQLGLISLPGSENARRGEQSIEIAIHAAAGFGAPLIYLPSFGNGEIRDEAGLRRTVEVMQWACDLAAREDVLVATENTLSATDNLRLLAMVDRPNARVLLDTQNPALWGHHVPAYVDTLWPCLADQVHVKDGREGQMGNMALGDGQADFLATVEVLQAHGFVGSLISENDYSGVAAGNAARDVALLTKLFTAGA